MLERKLRRRRMKDGGTERVVILDGFVRQVIALKKTKKGAVSLAKKYNSQKWRGHYWHHKVVKTDQGYAVVVIPKHIPKDRDKFNSVKFQKKYLID